MSKRNKLFSGFRHLAIAKRITLLYGGIFTLTLLFLSGFMILNISSMQQSTMRRELYSSTEAAREYLDKGAVLSDAALKKMQGHSYVDISIFSYEENRMYSSASENPPFILPPDAGMMQEGKPPYLRPQEMQDKGFEINVQREHKSGSLEYILENSLEQRFMIHSVHHQTENGMYRIQAYRMMADGAYMIWNFMSKLLIADIIGILGAFLIGQYISRRVLRPVEAIRETAERISIEDLSQRISTEGPDDEMKELTVTFNSMIERLDSSFQKQNQFVSDASHELRTPISVIQGYANLINRWGKSDPDILQESIDSILMETDHMSALIRQLLFLAKSDQNKLNLQKVQLSLNEAAQELVREMELMDMHAEITYLEDDQAEVFADYDLVKQLLWIHGENALKYSGENGKIQIRVWKDEKYGYVSVEDNGAGIAEEDIPKVFDRFYRADKSRNKEIAGTGLGLAIAKWIMDSHDGEIIVKSRLGEGTAFINRFHLSVTEEKSDVK